jgi:dihydroorotase
VRQAQSEKAGPINQFPFRHFESRTGTSKRSSRHENHSICLAATHVGHGGASFVFNQAIPAVRQGLLPNSISTDLHVGSMNAGMKDMTNVMSKFLNMGMSLPDVLLRSTWQPAKEIGHEDLGNLSVGSPADIAVLRVEKGKFGFVDSLGGRLDGHLKLACELTVRNGLVVWDLNGVARDPWQKRTTYNPNLKWKGMLPLRR